MAYDKAEYISKQNEVKEKLENQIKALAESYKDDPKIFAEVLKFNSKFYQYSPRNNQLIFLQNPYATFTDSFMGFKKHGYNIKRGEHGLKILVPVQVTYLHDTKAGEWIQISKASQKLKQEYTKNEIEAKTVQRYKIGTVFDISQTDCPVEDYPKLYDMGYNDPSQTGLYECLKRYSERQLNCTVKESDLKSISLRGQFFPVSNHIEINHLLKDSEKLSTLIHELGHAILHNEINSSKATSQKEFEADALAIMISSHFGIELTEGRMRHLSSHFYSYSELLSEQAQNSENNSQLENIENIDKVLENVSSKFKDIIPGLSESISAKIFPDDDCEISIKGLYRHYNGDEFIHYTSTKNGDKEDCLTNGVKCWTDDKNAERIKALERVETINIERMEKRIGRNRPGHNAKQALEAVKSMQQHTQPQAVPVKK